MSLQEPDGAPRTRSACVGGRAADIRAGPTVRLPPGRAADIRPGRAADIRAGRGTGRVLLGRSGEDLACEALEAAGLRVVARNWRCRAGEIDVVAAGPGLLVFCEVKTRRSSGYGTPAAAVTGRKRARLRLLATAFLAANPRRPSRIRFDVVTVTWPRGGGPAVEHLQGAF